MEVERRNGRPRFLGVGGECPQQEEAVFELTVDLEGSVRVLVVISGETKCDVRPERRRRQVPKSNRTSPPSSFSRASNFLPDFDSNPLSTAVRPCSRSDRAVRTLTAFPATFFQMETRHPLLQPLQP